MQLDQIPEVQKAVAKAADECDARRDYAFTDLPEKIGRLAVAQLSVRHVFLLFAVRSPFLCGGERTAGHIAQFLWIVKGPSSDDRSRFLTRVAKLDALATLRAIERYLDRAFMDAPGGPRSSGSHATASFAAAVVHRLAEKYGWAENAILDLPIARCFQYLRLMRRDDAPEAVQINPLIDRARRLAFARWKRAHRREWKEANRAQRERALQRRKTRRAAKGIRR